MVHIVDIQIRHLREMLERHHIRLEFVNCTRQHLAEAGYDPVYGARPLKRVIQREVQDPLALTLLRGEFSDGDTVQVDARDGRIVFAWQQVSGVLEVPDTCDCSYCALRITSGK